MEQATRDDFIQWLVHPLTKAVLIRLELDEEIIKDEWALGNYESPLDAAKAQGKAKYTKALAADIRTIKPMEEENEFGS